MAKFALCELILLEVYALIGGALHLRRLELGFDPISSPERELEQAEVDRQLRRQKVFDDVYRKLRVRETPKAIAAAREWFESLPNLELQRDVAALLEASRSWSEPKGVRQLRAGADHANCWRRASRDWRWRPRKRPHARRRPSHPHWRATPSSWRATHSRPGAKAWRAPCCRISAPD